MLDLAAARRQMIEQQVRAWEVLDLAVLSVMERVPREEFAPTPYRELAFADMCVPLGHGQSMLAPNLEGRILQSLEVQPGDRVGYAGMSAEFFERTGAGDGRDFSCDFHGFSWTMLQCSIVTNLPADVRRNLAACDWRPAARRSTAGGSRSTAHSA